MSHVSFTSRPKLDRPIVIAAFEGWNDAGEAATQAMAHLGERWDAQPFAEIDPEEFYDFTTVRPHIYFGADGQREIDWPSNTFSYCGRVGTTDVVLFSGIEPQMRWKGFCREFLSVVTAIDARLVMSLGALLADVPHSRPSPVFGTAYEPSVIDALDLEPSTYEGPTGVVGVLHTLCRDHGINSASLWAAVPAYVAAAPSPKAAHALVDRVCAMLGTSLESDELVSAASDYEAQIGELVAEDEETSDYVAHLEELFDRDNDGSAIALVREVEQFLREQ